MTYSSDAAVDYLPFGNGRVLAKAFDQNYGIAGITDSAVDGMDLDYTLDAVGNVTGLAERVTGGNTATRAIDYDGLDRLTALKDGASTVQAFTYDATGNRASKTAGITEAYTYPTDSHRLTAVGGVARGYDAAGNTTTMGASRAFLYDDRGRLAQLTDGGVPTREYAYNARGERVAKRNPTVSGGDITYVYDESGHLLGEYDAGGLRIKEYVWLDDTLVAVFGDHGGSDHQYVLTDHLGTPRAVVHPGSNALLWRWDLTASAFGDHPAQSDPDGDGATYNFNLRYPGQYFDVESGLHYNYFRDYDPATGRYVQSDPIGLTAGTSTYGYAYGSPLTYLDILGLICRKGIFSVAAPASPEYSEVRGTESVLKAQIPVVLPQVFGVVELADASIQRRTPKPFGFGHNGDFIQVEFVRDLLEFFVNIDHHYFDYEICEDECGNVQSMDIRYFETVRNKTLTRRAKLNAYPLPARYLGPETPITFP